MPELWQKYICCCVHSEIESVQEDASYIQKAFPIRCHG
jgi:hypothetical protein